MGSTCKPSSNSYDSIESGKAAPAVYVVSVSYTYNQYVHTDCRQAITIYVEIFAGIKFVEIVKQLSANFSQFSFSQN